MPMELHNSFVSAMVDILADKDITTENIYKLINLLCDTFAFDAGLIYETAQTGTLHLKEHHSSSQIQIHEELPLSALPAEVLKQLSCAPMLAIDTQNAEQAHEKELLSHFSAASLVATCVLDDSGRIYSLLIFLNAEFQGTRSKEMLDTLCIALKILEKAISTRMYKKLLFSAQHFFENILENTGIDIYVNDFYTHEILYVNHSMAAPYGGKEKFMGNKCWETLFTGQNGPCVFCPQKKLIDDKGNPNKVYSWDYQRAFDGSWFRVFSSAFTWVDGRLAHVVSSADITDNKRNEELIHYMANYDTLTKLPNRRMLLSECERRISLAKPEDKGYMLFFDIDGFKSINDNYGHEAGDEFLVELGAFFSGIPMLKNAIYRNGGDEFVALIDDGATHTNIRNLASFIHNRFQKTWQLKAGAVKCNVSLGVSCFPEDGNTPEVLLNKADQAMYYIKKKGGGQMAFYHEMQ